jgi:hypothetical protein
MIDTRIFILSICLLLLKQDQASFLPFVGRKTIYVCKTENPNTLFKDWLMPLITDGVRIKKRNNNVIYVIKGALNKYKFTKDMTHNSKNNTQYEILAKIITHFNECLKKEDDIMGILDTLIRQHIVLERFLSDKDDDEKISNFEIENEYQNKIKYTAIINLQRGIKSYIINSYYVAYINLLMNADFKNFDTILTKQEKGHALWILKDTINPYYNSIEEVLDQRGTTNIENEKKDQWVEKLKTLFVCDLTVNLYNNKTCLSKLFKRLESSLYYFYYKNNYRFNTIIFSDNDIERAEDRFITMYQYYRNRHKENNNALERIFIKNYCIHEYKIMQMHRKYRSLNQLPHPKHYTSIWGYIAYLSPVIRFTILMILIYQIYNKIDPKEPLTFPPSKKFIAECILLLFFEYISLSNLRSFVCDHLIEYYMTI